VPQAPPRIATSLTGRAIERLGLVGAGTVFGVLLAIVGLRPGPVGGGVTNGAVRHEPSTTVRSSVAPVPTPAVQPTPLVAPIAAGMFDIKPSAASAGLADSPRQPATAPAAQPAAIVTPAATAAVPVAVPPHAAAIGRRPERDRGVTPRLVAALHRAPTNKPAPVRRATRSAETPFLIGTVQQYASAYSRLDARATRAVWPGADRQGLVASFTGLREQRLSLAACAASVAGDSGAVTCRGTLRYRPRVGDHTTRTRQGRWRFDMTRQSGAWVIASVQQP
jgi:hypothetical protein